MKLPAGPQHAERLKMKFCIIKIVCCCLCLLVFIFGLNIFINSPNSSIFFHFNSGSAWGWSLSQLSQSKRRGTLWTCRRSVAGLTKRDRQPLTPTATLESPVKLTWKFWTVGGSQPGGFKHRNFLM